MTEAGSNEHGELLQRALVALDDMEADLRASEARQHEPIAVVGMGVRLPGSADDPEAFWDLLSSGRDAVTEIPADRWNIDGMFDPDPGTPGKSYTRWGGFVDGIDRFDATLFGISPREAVSMDPQQRLLLEVAWETFEHAGVASTDVAGSATGVFLGLVSSDYSDLALQGGVIDEVDPYFASGVAQSVAAGRLAYTFDLQGPALTVDTACSSSAYATHLAIQALRNRECDAALAGGVSLMLSPDGHIMTSQAKMMSFEGRCKTFDAGADGYVRGEGCALVYLKRLSDAVDAGDHVLAVLRGSAVNQDGRSNGLTAPNAAAQEAVIRRALADGGVDPVDVDVVECHGTGTTLGDPIEVRALDAVFGPGRSADRPLRIQSVKTNIGHLEGTAGVAGLCKLILALGHGELPRHLHLNEPNPYIDWNHISVVPEAGPWTWDRPDSRPRIGGLSSFGFSGTNVHVVVEAAPPAPHDDTPSLTGADSNIALRPWRLHVTSGRTNDATAANAQAHADAVDMQPAAWRSTSRSSTLGRTHLDQRVAVVANDASSVIDGLRGFANGESSDDVVSGRRGNVGDGVVMMFAGQGSQRPGMGRLLHATEPVFRARFDECDSVFSDLMGTSLSTLVFDGDDATLNDTTYTQPALFSIEVALTALWQSWGVEPVAVLGHSIGEIAAAHVAGVMSLTDATTLVEARGRLMGALPHDGVARGIMAAVFADVSTVRAAIGSRSALVSIAAENGPHNTVISGRVDAIDEVISTLEASGLRVIRLDVSHAFHSPLMEPMLDDFSAVLESLTLHEPTVDVISNRTGMVAEVGELTDPTYWRNHIRESVRFGASIGHAVELGYRCLLEVGPNSTLTAMAQACTGDVEVLTVASLRKGVDDDRALQRAVAALHVGGVDIDWNAYESPRAEPTRLAALPTYRFDRQRFWHDAVSSDQRGHRSRVSETSFVGTRLSSPSLSDVVFERNFDSDTPGWLAEHVIHDVTVVPATAFNELMYQAAQAAFGDIDGLADITIVESLALDAGAVTLQAIATPTGDVSVVSHDGDGWVTHARGRALIRDDDVVDPPDIRPASWADEVWTRCDQPVEGQEYYDALVRLGVGYGPLFCKIVSAGRTAGEVIAELDAGAAHSRDFDVHPALADACLQSLGLALPGGADLGGTSDDVYMPVGIDRWSVAGPAAGLMTVHGRIRGDITDHDAQLDIAVGDLEMVNVEGAVVAVAEGVRFKRVARSLLRPVEHRRVDNLYTPLWRAAPLPSGAADLAGSGAWIVVGPAAAATQLSHRLGQRSSVIDITAGTPPADTLVADVSAAVGDDLAGIVIVLPSDFTPQWSVPAFVAAVAVALGLEPSGVTLAIVTGGSAAVVHGDAVKGANHAANWGVGRVAANEIPQLTVRMVDAESINTGASGVSHAWVDQVASELDAADPDREVAWRDGVRYAQRLVRSADTGALPVPPDRYELVAGERGRLDALNFVEREPLEVEPGAVLIDVRATGLNFRDVLNVLGQYAGDASSLGGECAGRVLAIGEGVSRVAVGDRVMAIADRSFARQCVVDEHMVMRQPVGCTDAEAATIPIAFGTARYGLSQLARLGRGDRVLIHAATGGVGSAAVQLAQQAGAEIFATAGSPQKRAELRSIGVEHVYDSRSIDFRDEILRDTDGAGVDVILNSLTGDAIGASIDVLAADGRFVEIGKAGIWDDAAFAERRPHADYHVLFLGQVCLDDPLAIATLLDGLTVDLAARELRPLRLVAFDIRHSIEAFRYMAQARHIGKVVVTASPGWNVASSTGAWIISGGLGGLGLTVARQLAESGAQRIVLCSRRAATGDIADIVADIATICPDVRIRSLDVGDQAAIDAIVAETVADGTGLAGLIHTAAALDDGLLRDLDAERFDTVRRAKVDGARHLLAACDPHHPDHVVFFSAGAVLFGSQTQANYTAANAELDALAHQRRAAGLPAQTINWGPWSEVGMAAALGDQAMRRWEAQGVLGISSAAGTSALRAVIERGDVQTAVLDLRWSALLHHFSKHSVPPLLDELVRAQQRGNVVDIAAESGFVQQLLEVDVAQRPGLLRKLIRHEVFDVLGLDSEHPVGPQDGLSEVGMDSLMAVELSNRLTALTDHTLASTVAFEHSTLDALGAYVTDLLADDVEFEQLRPDDSSSEFDELSASELTDALMQELEDSGY